MSNTAKISGFSLRNLPLLLTCLAFAGFSAGAWAQAAPQLLPYTVTIAAGGGTQGATAVVTTYNPTASPFTVGSACATGSSFKALDAAGDGCLATQVRLAVPRAAAVDSEGNLFIVDSNNQSIRRVDAHTGIITTIAGTIPGTPVYPAKGAACATGSPLTATSAFGDGCLATQIPLAAPEGITVDAEGNVWFTDYTLGSVREVVKSTGIINTIVNTTGNVGYKADNVAYTKTGIAAANGLLYRPYGLSFDKSGNLYIADNYNNVVDVVNLGSTAATIAGYTVPAGEIFTIAGSGCPYVSTVYTATLTSSQYCGTSAYYGHSNGNSPYPSTGSTLDSPYQVAVDNSGTIYIADEYPYDVRAINGTTGDISTFAGVANSHMAVTATLSRGPANSTALGSVYGVATDSFGNVYTSMFYTPLSIVARVDIANAEIYPIAGQYDTAVPATYGGTVAPAGALPCAAKTDAFGDGCPGTQATFYKPYQPVVDAAGNLYVTDQDNYLIRKVSVGTQFPPTVIGSAVTQNIEVHFGVGDGPAATSAYALPAGFTEFATGTPACTANSDTTKDCVVPITFTPSAAGARSAPLTVTSGKGLVSSFALTGTGLAAVLAVDPGAQATLASSGVASVSDIALDTAGNVYAAVPGASSIVKVNPASSQSTVGSSLSGANAVAVDAAGNVYAALSSGKVYEIPANGGSQIALGSFTDPAGLAVDSFGNLYVSDSSAKTVYEIMASTGQQVPLPMGSLSSPSGVAVDAYGNVFVADAVGNLVIELPFNGAAAVTLGSGLDAPLGLAVDPAGSLYVADSKNSRIVYIPNESGTLNSADQMAIITGLGTPSGVAFAGNGTVYVADSFANAIYTFTRSAATINLGNALTAIGNQPAATNQALGDIISMGTQPAVFGASFAAATGNTGDFSLSPSSIPNSSLFPEAGYGVELTASFTPTVLGNRSATYSFDSTTPAAQPTLTLNGSGIQPHDVTTASITSTPPAGQTNWVYGQTVVVNITVSVNSGLPAPTGSVSVYLDGSSTATGSPSLTAGTSSSTASLSFAALSAGPHSVSVSYGGDTESSASTATLPLTLAKAPLSVVGSTLYKPFDAPLPTLTGTLSGVVNSDIIGVTYSTTALWNSPVTVAGYPIVPSVTGAALGNYTVTPTNGTLYVTQDSTLVALATSAISVNSTTQVTLTATVANQTSYAGGTAPTGNVTFYNTVGNTTTSIGTAQLNSSGVGSFTTNFAVIGATTNNSVTAVYVGDNNFLTSTSAPLTIVSGVPTFAVTQSTNTSLTVTPGESGLLSFTLAPAFGYNGTISFSCTSPSSTITCSFSPPSIAENGSGSSSLVAVTINSNTATSSLDNRERPGLGKLPLSLAVLPGMVLLLGFGALRRKLLRGYLPLLLLGLSLAGLGFSGCSSSPSGTATPAGAQTVTIVASGTGGSFASVLQQFTVTLTVQ